MSVSLDATADVRDGVALVTARVSNPSPVDREVTLHNRLDGPVLPPRRHGAPVRGWSDAGFEGVVPAEDTLAVGYACPVGDGPSVDRPLELVSVGAPSGATAPPAERARRDLAPARPPRDAVPLPGGGTAPGPTSESDPAPERRATAVPSDGTTGPDRGSDADPTPESAVPDPVDAYLSAVERRLVLGERLTDAPVEEATDALSDAGAGTPPVAELPDALAADADALESLAERADRLAERARATDVPVTALRRLA